MTTSNWIAVIIAVTQIITSVVIATWQVKTAKQLANPDKNQEKPQKTFFGKQFRVRTAALLAVAVFCLAYTIILLETFMNPVFNQFSVLNICVSTSFIVFSVLSYFMVSTSEHLLTASKCHMERLDQLIDRPCKDKPCPF